jgi:hypothetical protein
MARDRCWTKEIVEKLKRLKAAGDHETAKRLDTVLVVKLFVHTADHTACHS